MRPTLRRIVGSGTPRGFHLDVIDAAPDPQHEAWATMQPIDDVCRESLACDGQLVVAAIGGNARHLRRPMPTGQGSSEADHAPAVG